MRKVNFVGDELTSKYGEQIELNASSWRQILSLMEANFHNFKKSIIDGSYAIVRGRSLDDYDESLTEENLGIVYDKGNWEWFIVSEAVGAGGNGVLSFIAGAILTVVGAIYYNPALIQFGVGLMLGGAATMLSPGLDAGGYSSEDVDQKSSFLYNGGVNNIEQGGVVPVVLGQCYAGSVLISSTVNIMEKTSSDELDTFDIKDFITETF